MSSLRKRGRPQELNNSKIAQWIISEKSAIITEDGRIRGKNDNVWEDLQKKLAKVEPKVPASLYTFVTCNRNKVRDALLADLKKNQSTSNEDNLMRSRDATESTLHDSDIIVQTPYDFVVHVPATEFDDLLEIRAHTSKKNKTKKEVVRLREGWGDWLVEKIRNQERSSCAYQFAGHYVATDESSGSTSGGCKCGGNIKCDIKRTENNIVEIRCNATKGPGQCGKRQLKGETRKILSQRLRGKSVYAVRSEMANELIGDDEEDDSPFLYTSGVMRTVKWQTAASNHIHPDVWISLHLLCLEKMPHEIQYFCAAPFFLHWCTKHQLTVYNKLLNSLDKDHVCLAIDASGRFVKPLPLPNKLTTGPIFLYSIVAKNSTCQVPIAQMLSARHTTVAIQFWLTTWREQGTLPIPKEVVTDRSLALMAACVIAFTRERTVIEYADVFFKELPVVLPTCYIRLDVAHFLKNYRDLLDKVGRPVRQFYLAGLGKLIRCEKRQEAERIIRALLTISSSEGDGPQSNGEESTIQHEKKFMETLLTDEDYEFQSLEESILIERDGTPETQAPEIQPTEMRTQPSEWYNWVTMLNSDVVKKIEQKPGKPRSANAHFFPGFAEKLMADVKYLPLWSCITRNCFGYGRNPASSSQVEGEFKNLRSLLLPSKGYKPPIRADDFIQVYSTHLNGLSKIKRVEIVKKNTADQTTENAPQHFPSTESNEEQDNKTDTEGTIASHSSEDMDISFSSSGMIVMDPLRCPKCLVAIHDDAYCSSPLDESHVTNRKICKFCKQVNPEEFSTDSDTDLHEQGTEHSKADESHGYDSLFPCILSNNDIDRSNTDIRLDYNYASNQKTSSPIVPSIRKKIPSNKRITFSQTNTADNILDISHSSRELENADGDQCRINQFKECVACGEETEDNDKCGFCNFLIHPRDSCSVLYRIQHQVSDVRICFSCEKDLEKAAQYLIGDLDMDLTIDRMDKTPLKISNDRTNFESSAIKPTDELTCPVCKRAVGSAHKCKNCHLPVHAIDICSIPDAEADEGFGQLRICHICSKSKTSMVTGSLVAETNTKCGICQKSGSKMRICILCNYHVHTSGDCSSPCNEDYRGTPQGYICKTCSRTEGSGEFLEMRCLENWMGEAKKSQAQEKRGYYLQNNFSKEIFVVNKKLAAIPLLKSGDNRALKPVILNRKRVDLKNTCAFDSCSQLFLSALSDSVFLASGFQNYMNINLFIKMLLDVKRNGISKRTYRLRAEILQPIATVGVELADCVVIDARTTIGGLCRSLLKNISVFKEITSCDTCNYQLEKIFPLTSLSIEALVAKNYIQSIENDIIISQSRVCSEYQQGNGECLGRISSDLTISDDQPCSAMRFESDQVKATGIEEQNKNKNVNEQWKISNVGEQRKIWFCHFDDDNYVNVPRLVKLLDEYSPSVDWYLGKPSIFSPLEIHLDSYPTTSQKNKTPSEKISFWFATGGAGFCLSRALTMKMLPIAGGGKFISIGRKIRFPDDVTMGFIIEHLLKVPLRIVENFHSHLEPMEHIRPDTFPDQVSFSYAHMRNQWNVIKVDGFDLAKDPKRFYSLHCKLFPYFSFCPPR